MKKRKYRLYKRFFIKSEEGLVKTIGIIRRRYRSYDLSFLKMIANGHYYTNFYISKKNGGLRFISKPNGVLADIQMCLVAIFKTIYRPNENVFGFIENKSIIDNAKKHVGKSVVLNIDLKNFFNSINYDIVIEKLMRQPYYFAYKPAKLVADLLTVKTEKYGAIIPQGAPSSPLLTNMIADHLDVRLSKFAEKYDMTYTRYADDITFSFDTYGSWRWNRGRRSIIYKIIESEGFIINKHKIRTSFKGQRQEVTGLIVNKKVNVKREYIKRLRTELHNWEKDGYIISSYKYFKHLESDNNRKKLTPMERVIEGKISFVKMVKGSENSTYVKLKERFDLLKKRDAVFIRN